MSRDRRNELTFAQAMPEIMVSLDEGHSPVLLGEPAIGKSSLIQDLARKYKTKVFTLAVNQLGDKMDLTGVRLVENPKEKGDYQQVAYPHLTIGEAVRYAETYPNEYPILFLDEFNRTTKDVTGAILSLLTDRKIGSTTFPDNLRIIIAGNDEGNITSVDGASISRLAIFKVRPDIETFMGLQTLNPFVEAVLNKHPEDLVAPQLVVAPPESDSDDDAKSNSPLEDLLGDSEMGEGFIQIARPRTITKVSEWLNGRGIDMSGSDEETEILSNMISDRTQDGSDDDSVLRIVLEGYVGTTTFTENLYAEIKKYFQDLISQSSTPKTPKLNNIRPNQDNINALTRADNQPDVETLITSMNQTELIDMLVWLTEMSNTREVNNNSAIEIFMINAPEEVEDKSYAHAFKNLMPIISNPSITSKVAIEALLRSDADLIKNRWAEFITTFYNVN